MPACESLGKFALRENVCVKKKFAVKGKLIVDSRLFSFKPIGIIYWTRRQSGHVDEISQVIQFAALLLAANELGVDLEGFGPHGFHVRVVAQEVGQSPSADLPQLQKGAIRFKVYKSINHLIVVESVGIHALRVAEEEPVSLLKSLELLGQQALESGSNQGLSLGRLQQSSHVQIDVLRRQNTK